MAQRLIPGGSYVNETGAKQHLVPGGPLLNETLITSSSVTITVTPIVFAQSSGNVTIVESTSNVVVTIPVTTLSFAQTSGDVVINKKVVEAITRRDFAQTSGDALVKSPIAELISRLDFNQTSGNVSIVVPAAPAAVTKVFAVQDSTSSSSGTWVSPSVTSAPGRLFILVRPNNDFSTPASGLGLTWTPLGSGAFWAQGTSSSTGTISANYTNGFGGQHIGLFSFDGAAASNPIKQTVRSTGNGVRAVTLAAFANANNATFGVFTAGVNASNVTWTPEAGYTTVLSGANLYAELKTTSDTSVTVTATNSDIGNTGFINWAFEFETATVSVPDVIDVTRLNFAQTSSAVEVLVKSIVAVDRFNFAQTSGNVVINKKVVEAIARRNFAQTSGDVVVKNITTIPVTRTDFVQSSPNVSVLSKTTIPVARLDFAQTSGNVTIVSALVNVTIPVTPLVVTQSVFTPTVYNRIITADQTPSSVASTFASIANPGFNVWVNPANAVSGDAGAAAYLDVSKVNPNGHLKLSNFTSAIAELNTNDDNPNFTILGIEVSVVGQSNGADHRWNARLTSTANGGMSSSILSSSSMSVGSYTGLTIGGAANLWGNAVLDSDGVTTRPWAAEDFNSGFSIDLTAECTGAGAASRVYCDYATVRVYYQYETHSSPAENVFIAVTRLNMNQISGDHTVVGNRPFKELVCNIAESLALNTTAIRSRKLVNPISESLTVVPNFARSRKLSASIAEAESMSVGSLSYVKSVQCLINEVESLGIALKRSRSFAVPINETEAMSLAALRRIRSSSISVVEALEMSISSDKVKSFIMFINESMSLSTSVKRARQLVDFTINEAAGLMDIGRIDRARKLAGSIAEVEAATVAIVRARKLAEVIAETEAMFPSLARNRGVGVTVNEVETLSMGALIKIKLVACLITEGNFTYAAALKRVRGLEITVAEAEAMIANFKRARGIVVAVPQSEAVTVNVVRMRKVIAEITENQTLASAIDRVRGVAAVIAEQSGYTFNIIVRVSDPNAFFIEVTWQEFVTVGDSQVLSEQKKVLKISSLTTVNVNVVESAASLIVGPDDFSGFDKLRYNLSQEADLIVEIEESL